MKSAVLFMIFNRPKAASRVFEEIRSARPPRIYVAADGPRSHREGEREECEESRNIVKDIDWPCEVKTLFQAKNLGPMYAQVAALNWFFEQEMEGVILEDDCVPNQSFFQFCDDLLEHYRNDRRVFMISGNNFQNDAVRGSSDYYFSSYTHIWGWATWKRSWDSYDSSISDWPEFRKIGGIDCLHQKKATRRFWIELFDRIYRGEYKRGWDYRFLFACWRENGLVIIPQKNLVSNIGFNMAGTNCTDPSSSFSNIRVDNLQMPLKHPKIVFRNIYADLKTSDEMFSHKSLLARALPYLRKPRKLVNKSLSKIKRTMR